MKSYEGSVAQHGQAELHKARRPSKPKIPGSNPGGPATHGAHLYFCLFAYKLL